MPNVILLTAVSAIVRAASVLITLFITMAATRFLGAEEAGYFLLGFTIITVLSTFFRLGLDNVILRAFGAQGISEKTIALLQMSVRWTILASSSFCIVGSGLSSFIAEKLFHQPAFSNALTWTLLSVPFVTLFYLLSFAFQGLHKIITAITFQNLGVGLIFLAIFLNTIFWFDIPMTAELCLAIYFISAFLTTIFSVNYWQTQSQHSMFSMGAPWTDAETWRACSNMWTVQSMQLAVQWAAVLIAASLIQPAELAHLSAAQRTANLTAFILIVVNMAVAPRYAKLWSQSRIEELRKLSKLTTRMMILVALPVVAVMVSHPGKLLSIFGEGFDQGALLLVILVAGQFVNVATGSVAYLLNMSGHERDLRFVTLISGPVTIVAAAILTTCYGATGAAIATAVGIGIQNICAFIMVKKRLGFYPIG